jgi:hypothetical protein
MIDKCSNALRIFLSACQTGLLEHQTSSANVIDVNLPQLVPEINGFGDPWGTFQIAKHAELWRKLAAGNVSGD